MDLAKGIYRWRDVVAASPTYEGDDFVVARPIYPTLMNRETVGFPALLYTFSIIR